MSILAVLFLFTMGLVYFFYKQRYIYWKRKGIQQLNPFLIFGDLQPWCVSLIEQFSDYYAAFKMYGRKYGGIYLYCTPALVIIDPQHIRQILVKDFQHFNDRGIYFNEEKQPLSASLLFISGHKWKSLRQKLTQTFTSGKMRMMFATMSRCTIPLTELVEKMARNCEVIDVKDVTMKCTMDVIGSCAFGIECNSFEMPTSDFYKHGTNIIPHTTLEVLKLSFAQCYQTLSKKLGVTVLNENAVDFFQKVAIETYNYRKENDIRRDDFMQLLIELKDSDDENSISMDELVAQTILFFMAGFDTSAVTLSFCLFNLATHPQVQEKLREEINDQLRKCYGEISYETLQHMKYMDQVLKETMRLYPIVAVLPRVCTEKYRIPFSDFMIEEGTPVYIPIWALHRDPEYYPDPHRFNPERFSENERNMIPGTFLPFGDGPKICIGTKFAMMQMKICLVALLKDFKFSLNSRTRSPLELDFGLVTTPKGGIWLDAIRVS